MLNIANKELIRFKLPSFGFTQNIALHGRIPHGERNRVGRGTESSWKWVSCSGRRYNVSLKLTRCPSCCLLLLIYSYASTLIEPCNTSIGKRAIALLPTSVGVGGNGEWQGRRALWKRNVRDPDLHLNRFVPTKMVESPVHDDCVKGSVRGCTNQDEMERRGRNSGRY